MPGSSHPRPPSTRINASTPTGVRKTTTTSRPYTGKSRPRTAATSTGYGENEIICAITESRGISPTVGLSFVNLTTSEAVLCQFADTQTYARTCHKIKVFNPTEIIYMATGADSKLLSIVKENLEVDRFDISMTDLDRRYWSESTGFEYVQRLAFPSDLESLKVSIGGNYFATCCFAAVMKYVELGLSKTFASQTLRIRFETSEGSMMIDLSTISALELIQNLQNVKSKDSLFGLLKETLTKMGARILRSNILQPSTDAAKLNERYDAVGELVSKEEMFFNVRTALTDFVDTDRCLSNLVIIPTKIDFQNMVQSVNNVIMLKTFVDSIKPVWQALSGASSPELQKVRQLCDPSKYAEIDELIKYALNEDVTYASQVIELRNQRVFAIKAGINSFLDVARKTYKEIEQDVNEMVEELKELYDLKIDLKYEPARQYFLRIPATEFEDKPMPPALINTFRKKNVIECQTLPLMKMNQKLSDAHNEVISMSDSSVQELIEAVHSRIHPLFKISESLALLDMLAGMAKLVTVQDYVKPDITASTLALKASRHPILDKLFPTHFATTMLIANDVYSTPQHRFQIITGANMSGKSTYIRSIALNALLAQTGCFVPAEYASFPIFHQLFALLATDSNVEANVSSFASEMSSLAFILRNIESRSLVIVDELGRGTNTNDGLAIAIAIAEALIESKAYVWFVTHFHELPLILAERAGVVNLHLNVDIEPGQRQPSVAGNSHRGSDDTSINANDQIPMKMTMTYRIAPGPLPSSSQYYGLTLARTLSLPDLVNDVAARVSQTLHERNEANKSNPRALAVARRRKLVLGLREQIRIAKETTIALQIEDTDPYDMADRKQGLKEWLKNLQEEFVVRLGVIESEAAAIAADGGREDVGIAEDANEDVYMSMAEGRNDLRSVDVDMAGQTHHIADRSREQSFASAPALSVASHAVDAASDATAQPDHGSPQNLNIGTIKIKSEFANHPNLKKTETSPLIRKALKRNPQPQSVPYSDPDPHCSLHLPQPQVHASADTDAEARPATNASHRSRKSQSNVSSSSIVEGDQETWTTARLNQSEEHNPGGYLGL